MRTAKGISALVIAFAVLVSPAVATYRGANGRIAFAELGPAGADVYSVDPDGSGKRRLTSVGPDPDARSM